MKTIKILFIDPDVLFRKGFALYLNTLLNVEVVYDYASLSEMDDSILSNVNIVLFDTARDEDFEAFSALRKRSPRLSMLLLSSKNRLFENCVFASSHEINAFLSKGVSPDAVVKTIQRLATEKATEIVLPSTIQEQLFGETHSRKPFFTPKELSVLGLISKGKSTREAAQILNTGKRTIETHRSRMIGRFGCKNIIPVILYALNNNYIQSEV